MDGLLKEIDEKKREKMTPAERAEDDRRQKEVKDTFKFFNNQKKLKTGTPEEKRQAKEELDAEKMRTKETVDKMIEKIDKGTQIEIEALKQKTYKNIKRNMEEFRQKHGTEVSPAELEKEDQELRRRIGLK